MSLTFWRQSISEGHGRRKEAMVNGLGRAWMLLTVLWLTVGLIGCTESQARRQPTMTPVPISDIKQVVGKWEGMSKSVPDMRDDAEVLLMIDDKIFEFVGSRMADRYIVGAGTLIFRDGKVVGTTARLSTTFTLYDREGKSVLIVEVTRKDGKRFYGELTPAQ